MVFSTQVFLLIFLPPVLAVCHLLPHGRDEGLRNFFLLAASLLFYLWGGWRALPFLPATALVCWGAGRLIWSRPRFRHLWLWGAVLITVGGLAVCKYLSGGSTFIPMGDGSGGATGGAAGFALPLGISFYTFQALSYTMDCFRGCPETRRAAGFGRFLTYISLFPQLVAGPIVRWRTMAPQLLQRRRGWEFFTVGAELFMLGFGKKILLADPLGEIADRIFAADHPGSLCAWIGLAAYMMQLYFDFSGYSDMGIGLGRMVGFRLPANFAAPWRAASVGEFWRRWHITLSRWLRDYLYIPLGGSRKGLVRCCVNLMIVMTACGLWHGLGRTFAAFGAFHGMLLVLERLRKHFYPGWTPPHTAGRLWTLAAVSAGFVIFRSGTLSGAAAYLRELVGFGGITPTGGALLNGIWSIRGCAALAAALFTVFLQKRTSQAIVRRGSWRRDLWCLAVFALAAAAMLAAGSRDFIYFIF